MDAALHNKKDRFDNALQELEQGISALRLLQESEKSLPFRYELGSSLYGQAIIPAHTRTVGIWLGAGVMVQFELKDAQNFLANKQKERQEEMRRLDHDLNFLRRQITTMEVNLARLYNHVLSLQAQ